MLITSQFLGIGTIDVHAASGTIYSNADFIYTIDNGNVTITGYKGSGGDVIIPNAIDYNPVTSIGIANPSSSFWGDSVTSVVIPSSLTSISPYVFYGGCSKLKRIDVSMYNPVYTSVEGVLFNKSKTTLISFPPGKSDTVYGISKSVTTISARAFDSCTSLESVLFPDSLTSIGIGAFSGCTSLSNVVFSGSVTRIESGAFYNCTSLKSVAIPSSVTFIGSNAFGGCSRLTSAKFLGNAPDLEASVAGYPFNGCDAAFKVCYIQGKTGFTNPWSGYPTETFENVLSGTNRYETAVEISRASYLKANTVLLATGINFPDALSAGPLAIQENAPILLTETSSIPQATLDEIKRLSATKVIIMGGEGVVGKSVVTTLSKLGITVERVSGSSRFGTAVETAKRVRAKSGVINKVVLANGYGFADALSMGSYASKEGIPILLTDAAALSAETKAALTVFGINEVQIIGGYTVVSQNAENELKAMNITVTRTYGSNRFATSDKVAGKFFAGSQKVVIANGRGFADALTAVPLAAKLNAPIILVEQNSTPPEVSDYLTTFKIKTITVVGGDYAVGQGVKDFLINLILNN